MKIKLKVKSKTNEKLLLKLDIARFIIDCLQLLLVFTAIITIYFSVYPQKKPNNSNLLEKANAGDSISQLQLADFCYQTGDFSEAIYWYKLLIVGDAKDDYRALACNNLGKLYSLGYGLSDEVISEKERLNIALNLFEKSADMFSSRDNVCKVIYNKYILLVTFGEDMFDDYDNKIATAIDELKLNNTSQELKIVSEKEILSKNIIKSTVALPAGWKDENTFYTYSGMESFQSENGNVGVQYIYVRTVYKDDGRLPDIEYMPLEAVEENGWDN